MLHDDCDHEMSRLSACLTPRVLHSLRPVVVFLCPQPLEEAREEARAERAGGMCRPSSQQQLGKRIPVDSSINLQQGVAFVLVLHQG